MAILLMILGWAYMKKFSNKIHFGSADSTIWEVYFERKSKSILFHEKKRSTIIGQMRSMGSGDVGCFFFCNF